LLLFTPRGIVNDVWEGVMNPSPAHRGDAFRRSLHVQSEASAQGFDWPDVAGVLDKVQEELDEIRAALSQGDAVHARKELGDLLLASVNLARFLGTDPAEALHRSTDRFHLRVLRVCELLRATGVAPRECTLEALDRVWIEAKSQLERDESGSA
jgi:ATP diphosphatase